MIFIIRVINYIKRKINRLINILRFRAFGKNSYLKRPIRLIGAKYISIGKEVSILSGARMEAITKWNSQEFDPKLTIGNRVNIGQGVHIICTNSVTIEDDVVFAPYVYVSDCEHSFEDIDVVLSKRPLVSKEVYIGKNSFCGIGSKILSGVVIGKNCVIGANSLVLSDVPDYTMVAGNPAREIKRYNLEEKRWIKL